MLRVIRKELILNRNITLINVAIMAGSMVLFLVMDPNLPPRVYAGFGAVMMAILPATLVTREDKYNAMALGCSLPVRRKTIVQARFLLASALALAGVLLIFLLGAFLPVSSLRARDLFAWGPVLTAISFIFLLLSLFLPFSLRYGMKGILVFLVSAQVLGAVLLVIVQLSRSDADKRIVQAIAGFFAFLRETLGAAGFRVSWLVFLGVLVALSYRLSVRVFQNREF